MGVVESSDEYLIPFLCEAAYIYPPATVYTQVELPPLIPPMHWGKKEIYLVPSPL
jgi:hypothetical protein